MMDRAEKRYLAAVAVRVLGERKVAELHRADVGEVRTWARSGAYADRIAQLLRRQLRATAALQRREAQRLRKLMRDHDLRPADLPALTWMAAADVRWTFDDQPAAVRDLELVNRLEAWAGRRKRPPTPPDVADLIG